MTEPQEQTAPQNVSFSEAPRNANCSRLMRAMSSCDKL